MTKDKNKKPGAIKRLAEKCAAPANPFLAVLASLVTAGVTGWLAVTLSNPDQGKTVTPDDLRVRMARERLRIENHPNMPARAKAIALSNLTRIH